MPNGVAAARGMNRGAETLHYRMWVPVWRAPVEAAHDEDAFFVVPFCVVVVASQPLSKVAVTTAIKLFTIRVPIPRECRGGPRMSMAFVKVDA